MDQQETPPAETTPVQEVPVASAPETPPPAPLDATAGIAKSPEPEIPVAPVTPTALGVSDPTVLPVTEKTTHPHHVDMLTDLGNHIAHVVSTLEGDAMIALNDIFLEVDKLKSFMNNELEDLKKKL